MNGEHGWISGRKTPNTQSGPSTAWSLGWDGLGCSHGTVTFWVTAEPTPPSDLGPYVKCSEASQGLWDGPWVLQADLSKAQRLPEGIEREAVVFLSLFRC